VSRPTTRHTTRLDDLPEVVRITREHPLQGLPLPVVSLASRQDRLELLLQTPDGSKRFVPLEWTDADTRDRALPAHSGLVSLAGLLRLRTIVDALLQRLPAAEEKEDAQDPIDSAAAQARRLPTARSQRSGLGSARGGHPERRAGCSDEADRAPRERARGGPRA